MDSTLRDQLTAAFDADRSGVVAAYVFGSVARDESAAGSDIDIAVLWDRRPAATLSGERLTLEGALERRLGRPVDLIALNTAPSDLVHRVLRDGVLVVDRDRARRIRFEVEKRNEFFDLEPVRRRYRGSSGSPAGAR
ncbi:MAG: nucleotidyltransferase domain-containing protein [Acidobacteriota bacterium]|nr:nucleotidyltransferase domain-containing protein [Acidobacteriota bacterium]